MTSKRQVLKIALGLVAAASASATWAADSGPI